jgi:pyruvate dehydrogenase E2 component (dihydrolipoamide acetyltransferase)
MPEQICVPDIGEYSNVEVIEVHVKAGDTVAEEDALVTLETDKATMDIPAPKAGTISDMKLKEGDKVSEGDVILMMAGVAAAEVEAPKIEDALAAKTQAPAKTGGAAQVVNVPDIGEYSGVEVIEIHIKPGDVLNEEDPMVTLETDKATMDIPAPFAGTVAELKVKEGDKVSEGDIIAMVSGGAAAEAPAQSTPAPEKAEAPQAEAPTPVEVQAPAPTGDSHATPAVRRLSRELGIELTKLMGSGRKGRITTEDVQNYVKHLVQSGGSGDAGLGLLADPQVDFAKFGEIDVQPMPRIKKISGNTLHRNWVKIPHITLFDEANITDLEVFRKNKKAAAEKAGVKLSPVPFIVKAIAQALVEFPLVNSSLSNDGANLVYKKYVHVGVAVDTPNGLMVPVIRDADKKGVYDIARDLMDLATKARDGKLKPTDMQGGTFTISSLGGLGTTGFTPIVNMPEVGILGVSKAQMKPIYNGKDFDAALMLPLSLSLDHRVVDGAEGAKFLTYVVKALADLREILL